MNLDLATNSRVISSNAVDPLLNTQQLSSAVNFTKRYHWGSVHIGGNRRQSLNTDQLSMTLPAMTVNPKPVDLCTNITWSPTLSFTNDYSTDAKSFLIFPGHRGGRGFGRAGAFAAALDPQHGRRRSGSVPSPGRTTVNIVDRFDKKVAGHLDQDPE